MTLRELAQQLYERFCEREPEVIDLMPDEDDPGWDRLLDDVQASKPR